MNEEKGTLKAGDTLVYDDGGIELVRGAIAPAPLTDHAKYCRLSKQTGGLCGRRYGNANCTPPGDAHGNLSKVIPSCYTQCPYPIHQLPVELPKPDPLEELVRVYTKEVYECYEIYNVVEIERVFREFAEKVRAL